MEREYIENSEESEQKIFEIKKYGSESKMKIFLAMELFRLVFLFWFLSVIAVGAAVTIGFVETDYKKTIKSLVGSVNVCVYFDFLRQHTYCPQCTPCCRLSLFSIALLQSLEHGFQWKKTRYHWEHSFHTPLLLSTFFVVCMLCHNICCPT